MKELLELAVSNAVAASALAFVAAGAGLVWRRPALVHALWLLVLLKLVTPPLVRVPISWPGRAEATSERAEQQPSLLTVPPSPALPAEAEEWNASEDEVEWLPEERLAPPAPLDAVEERAAPEEPLAEQVLPLQEAPVAAASPRWPWAIAGLWMAGSAGWFVLAACRVRRFQTALRYAWPAPAELQERVARLARRLNLLRVPAVWLVPGRVAPMVWAAGGAPRLLLPVDLLGQLSPEGGDTLLVHELAHVKRRDHWVRLVEMIVLGLYWWHPVVWYARRELREAEEQCCDAWVVATLPGAGRAYAMALVDTLDFLSAVRAAVPPLASGIGQVADLKRRLTMIMRGDTPRALTWPACLAVLGLAALLPLLPSWAQAQPAPEERRKELTRALEVRRAAVQQEQEAADLARQEAELARRLAEVKAARAKLVARAHMDALIVKKAPEVRIEISVTGLKAEELKELVAKLEKALPGGGKRVIVIRGEKEGHDDPRIRFWGPDGKAIRVLDRPLAVRPPIALPPGGDRRIDGLEKKLDAVLRELEALRKEMQGRRPGAPGRGRPGGGVGPAPGERGDPARRP